MTFYVSILLFTTALMNFLLCSFSPNPERSRDALMLYSDKIFDTTECQIELDTILQKEIYSYVDQMPEFPGGPEAMYKFIYKNFKLHTVQDSMQYSIYAAFIIEADGSIKDAYAPRPYFGTTVSPLERELIRTIKLMPLWIPGTCNQKKVPVKFVLPIRF